MKKPVRLLALVLALACLAGCSFPETFASSVPSAAAAPASGSTAACTPVQQRGDYRSLPSNRCRRLYEKLLACAEEITDKKDKNGYLIQPASFYERLTDRETRLAVMAFFNDNPQIFWVSNQYTYTFTFSHTTVQLYSRVAKTERAGLQKKLDAAAAKALSGVSAGQTALARETALYQALAARCTYAGSSTDSQWQSYTSYGALVQGKAVCDGYARAMQLLCAKAGLQCRLVNGSSKGGAHIWNLIEIDGKWYHFDATWMDANVQTFDYFNLNDTQIQQDHTISPTGGETTDCNLPLPVAKSQDANYYQKCATQVTALDRANEKKIAAALVQAAQKGETAVGLHLSAQLSFAETIEGLFSGPPYLFSACVTLANRSLPRGKKLFYTGMRYSTAEAQRGITVQLSYDK
ncbi:MAG: hypothetical protein LKE53_00095 [Oscillospiraceae bacterium]|jgi:hypothetical protein|nr:hypothetical protein [Oscillospiraceae bacterium]MDD3261636.1 transglutaminase domain-containing protein [Oscillospiraceae bacterium]